MRAIITGGGTGGHIYPAIAIADKIREHEPDASILYIGNEIGLEKDIVPKSGYPIELVSAQYLDRRNLLKIFNTGLTTMRGVHQARRIMRKFKPDVVVGTGGFVCVPVMYAGHQYGARCYLHEQNAFPGVANKSMEPFVDKVFLGFAEASHYFRHPEKHVCTGNPVRRAFYTAEKAASRTVLQIPQEDFVLFSFGGSQGAEKINDVAFDLMEAVNGHPDVTMIFGTGSQYYTEILERAAARGITVQPNVRICSYINDMPTYLSASDLVISRAGALSVAETTVCGKAAILVPSPNVTGNHQYFNAKSVADRGGAVLIEEKALCSEGLIETVMRLRNNPQQLEAMGRASAACAPEDACEVIYAELTSGQSGAGETRAEQRR